MWAPLTIRLFFCRSFLMVLVVFCEFSYSDEFGTSTNSSQYIHLLRGRMNPIHPLSLDRIMSQQRITSRKRLPAELARPRLHTTTLGGCMFCRLVTFEIVDSSERLRELMRFGWRAEVAPEGHLASRTVKTHD